MRFSTDEIKPFYEVRQNLSKVIEEVALSSREIVIAKHGRPVAAVLSAAALFRYRELDRLLERMLDALQQGTNLDSDAANEQVATILKQLRQSQ